MPEGLINCKACEILEGGQLLEHMNLDHPIFLAMAERIIKIASAKEQIKEQPSSEYKYTTECPICKVRLGYEDIDPHFDRVHPKTD